MDYSTKMSGCHFNPIRSDHNFTAFPQDFTKNSSLGPDGMYFIPNSSYAGTGSYYSHLPHPGLQLPSNYPIMNSSNFQDFPIEKQIPHSMYSLNSSQVNPNEENQKSYSKQTSNTNTYIHHLKDLHQKTPISNPPETSTLYNQSNRSSIGVSHPISSAEPMFNKFIDTNVSKNVNNTSYKFSTEEIEIQSSSYSAYHRISANANTESQQNEMLDYKYKTTTEQKITYYSSDSKYPLTHHPQKNQLDEAKTIQHPTKHESNNPLLELPKAPHMNATTDSDLINKLPNYLQPYVAKLINVKGDGHCGYRAASFCLGRGQDAFMGIRAQIGLEIERRKSLYLQQATFLDMAELEKCIETTKVESDAPCLDKINKWMIMPSMADPMANVFETPVFFFSEHFSQTSFPHFTAPNNNPPIIIAFIRSMKHFVALEMNDPLCFPASRVFRNWRRSATPEALRWEERYEKCFQLREGSRN
jgi:hypothetical protein